MTTTTGSAAGANAGAVRLNTATITQYLASQTSLAEALRGAGKRRVILLRCPPEWDGPGELAWGEGLRARVGLGPSALAVHELILTHIGGGVSGPHVLVVLTDREHNELDPSLLARVHKQRIEIVDSWEVVCEAFGAAHADPRLKDANWAAEALLDATPPGGWPRLPGGVLSRRYALTELALRRLRLGRYDSERATAAGLAEQRLDSHTLLRWSLIPGGPERLLTLRGPERAGLIAFLGEDDQAGLAGRALAALIEAEHGPDAVAFGLVCAALWQHAGKDAEADTYRARGRAERWLGEQPPATGEQLDVLVSAFGRTCEEFVTAKLAASRSGADDGESARESRRITSVALEGAATLARQFGAESAAAASPLLTAGLEARFTAAARLLTTGEPDAAARAIQALRNHHLAAAPDARARIERVRMAQRLAQWLAQQPPAASDSVAASIQRQVDETGWVDRALEYIEAGGDPDPVLQDAYARVAARARRRRGEIDHVFARQLAAWTAAGTDPGAMLTVEDCLKRVIEPVVRHAGARRIMLLVIDGMSAAISCELAEDLRRDWAEYDPVPPRDGPTAPRRQAMAAALPTVTAVSRTSLFAGRLMKGDQLDEKRVFPGHRLWRAASAAVFHKDDLRAETPGAAFGPALTEALQDERTHIAVVLNTVDDRLAREQKLGDGAWRVDEIGKLRDLLRVAAANGMAVLITSDHGHVVDRHGTKVETAADPASARHRLPGRSAPDETLAETEIALSGPRVVWPEPEASIVALWDADSHYTARKAGYHGGGSLAEVAIPVLAFLPFGAEPPRHWRELGDPRPAWWLIAGESGAGAGADESNAVVRTARTEALATTDMSVKSAGARSKRERERSGGTGTAAGTGAAALFELALVAGGEDALVTAQAVTAGESLARDLLASPVFEDQMELLARKPPRDKIEAAVRELLDAGGTLPTTALAQRTGYPVTRADGFAAVLRQVLNYDGVQVLETLPDGRTLRLNRGLLRDQFRLRRRG